MIAFLIRRLLAMIPMLFGVSLLVFFLMYLAPGDFLDEARSRQDVSESLIRTMEKEYGLVNAVGEPNPWYVQYAFWLNGVSPLKFISPEGEFFRDIRWGAVSLGKSWAYNLPVVDLIKQRLPATVILSLCSLLFAWCLAVPLGVMAAIKKDSIWDRISAFFAYAALSIPEFFLAILAVYLAAQTGWFPTGGRSSIGSDFLPLWQQFGDYAWHLILPTIVLGLGGVAGMMRIMRAYFLDYMRAEFVTTARAKGLSEGIVMFRHVLRNAINPLITALGFSFASLLSGAVLVEKVMNYPGLGLLTFTAFMRQDQYVVMSAVILGCFMLMLGNLLADLLLAWSDPRIRLEDTRGPVRRGFFQGIVIPLLALGGLLIGFLALLAAVPWDDQAAMNRLVVVVKWVGGIGLLIALGVLLRFSWPVIIRVIKPLCRRPLGLASALVLLLLYFAALFAPFLATQSVSQSNLSRSFHPPTALTWSDGRLAVKLYENTDPAAAAYKPIPGESVPLRFFARGFDYHLFGFIPMNRHLIQPDYDALEARLGHPVEPRHYPVFLLGSDSTGRDIYSRLLYGSQISLSIGLIGITITMIMGFMVGGLAGYFGGRFDFASMRLVEFLMAVPGLYLLLALRSALAPHFQSTQMYLVIVIILSFIGWAGTARIIRGMSLSLRNRPFVLAAENLGQSVPGILTKHLLPNLTSYLLVAATLSIPGYILGEAALSFLGLGIEEPGASWGLMLKQAQDDMKVLMLNFWWMLTPGFAIFVTVVAFNLLGDALRDIVDPKMKTS